MSNWKGRGLWLLCLVMLSMLLLSPAYAADSALGIAEPSYAVISPTNDNSQMAVTWWDNPDAASGRVQYSETVNFSATPSATVYRAEATKTKTDAVNGYVVFDAVMTGLQPATTYYYRVGDGTGWTKEYSFTTAAADIGQVSFLYLGDIQYASAPTAKDDYAAWGDFIQGAVSRNPDLDFAIIGGDLVQNTTQAAEWQMFFQQATKVFAEKPLLAVAGNHECATSTGKPDMFSAYLDLPKNGPEHFKEEFYSYDYGDCHIVGLNTSVLMGEQLNKGSMTQEDFANIKQWIADDFANSNATWKFVVMHHPAYPVVNDATSAEVLREWEPLFVDAQVDMVFCGHQHIYMRTYPIKGVTYVLGDSGSKYYKAAEIPYDAKQIEGVSTYQIVKANATGLTMTTYNAKGEALDSVSLEPKDRTTGHEWITGDLNYDGVVDGADVDMLRNAIHNNLPYSLELDINKDGTLDIRDAHKLALTIKQAA